MRQIYIVLTHTGTFVSRMVKLVTRKKYSHVSISLDKGLESMYSFGRIHAYNPFWGGFVQESIKFGTYKRFNKSDIYIYGIDVTDEQYDKIQTEIENFKKDKKNYGFNFVGMTLAGIDKKINRKNHLYCAEFVKYMIESANIENDLPNVVKPEHFFNWVNKSVVYQGKLNEYCSREKVIRQ